MSKRHDKSSQGILYYLLWSLQPRCWGAGIGLLTMRALVLMPQSWQSRLGKWLGDIGLLLAGRRRSIAETNFRLCFPRASNTQIDRWVTEQFQSIGLAVFETANAWWGSDTQILGRFDVIGREHLLDAQRSGRGIVLLTGHFTTLELGGRVLCNEVPFHGMYRPHGNPVFDWIMRKMRSRRCGLPAIERENLRGVIRALRQGRAVWYAPDQNMGQKVAVDVPFFGIPARTITATSRLAQAGNAVVLPFFPYRVADGRYRLEILPALEDFPSADAVADAERINRVIERAVRRAPSQYLWVHRRFRTRRKDRESPYRLSET